MIECISGALGVETRRVAKEVAVEASNYHAKCVVCSESSAHIQHNDTLTVVEDVSVDERT